METEKEYTKDQIAFSELSPREQELYEQLYHIKQIHRLLYLINDKLTKDEVPEKFKASKITKKV